MMTRSQEAKMPRVQEKNRIWHSRVAFVVMASWLLGLLASCAATPEGAGSSTSAIPAKHQLDTTTPIDTRYMKLGEKAEKEGKVELAAILYRAAALANEKDMAPRAASAELFEKSGEYQPAAALYGALAKETDNANYILAAARNLLKAGEYADAKAHYETAIVKQPADWRGFNGLAVVHDFTNNHKAAIENYTLAFDKAPDAMKPSVAMNKALSLMLDNKAGDAVATLEPLAGAAESPPIRQRLALAYALAGRTDDAKRLGLVKIPTNDDLQNILRGGGAMRGDDETRVTVPAKP